MSNKFPESHGVTGMFTVVEVRGPLLKLKWWDQNYKEIDNIYAGDVNEPSIEAGSIHMMELVVRGGLLKVEFCSPAYDEFEVDIDPDDEGDEFFGEGHLH